MTEWFIFYVFIHFNSTAAMLFKCWWAAYINPLRQGWDRLGQGRFSFSPVLLSIIYHDIFICLCLFTCLVSIHLHPASHSLFHLPPCSFLHRCNTFISVTPIFYLQWVPMLFLSLGNYLSRWAVSVYVRPSFCLSVSEPRDLVPLVDSLFHYDCTLAMELWQKL